MVKKDEEHSCDFERKFEEQWNKKALALHRSVVSWVAGTGLVMLFALIGVYISLEKHNAETDSKIANLQQNQITSKELASALADSMKPLADQIAKIAEKNNEQDKEIFKLGLMK